MGNDGLSRFQNASPTRDSSDSGTPDRSRREEAPTAILQNSRRIVQMEVMVVVGRGHPVDLQYTHCYVSHISYQVIDLTDAIVKSCSNNGWHFSRQHLNVRGGHG